MIHTQIIVYLHHAPASHVATWELALEETSVQGEELGERHD
jgi:hypothetical protein